MDRDYGELQVPCPIQSHYLVLAKFFHISIWFIKAKSFLFPREMVYQSTANQENHTNRIFLLLFSHSVMSNSLGHHGLEHARLPCPSSTPRACSNSCPLSQWCHPTISSSAVPFSSRLQSFPASGSFLMRQVFSNESALCSRWPKYCNFSFSISSSNEYSGLFPLGWTGLISLQSKGLSRVFSNTTVQKHQFFHI